MFLKIWGFGKKKRWGRDVTTQAEKKGTAFIIFGLPSPYTKSTPNLLNEKVVPQKIWTHEEFLKVLNQEFRKRGLPEPTALELHLNGVISQEEYISKKETLLTNKMTLEEKIKKLERGGNIWLEQMEEFLKAAHQADQTATEENLAGPSRCRASGTSSRTHYVGSRARSQ